MPDPEACNDRRQLALAEEADLVGQLEDRGECLVATVWRQRGEGDRQRAAVVGDADDGLAQPYVPVPVVKTASAVRIGPGEASRRRN